MEYLIKIIAIVAIVKIILVFFYLGWNSYKIEKSDFEAKLKAWQQFAASEQLDIKVGKFRSIGPITGDFRGHSLSIGNINSDNRPVTIFELNRKKTSANVPKQQTDEEIMRRFWAAYNILKPELKAEITVGKIVFRTDVITCKEKLQAICDQMANMIEIYPRICKMGGRFVDAVLQTTSVKPFTWQIIKSVSHETAQRIKAKSSLLLCKKCYAFCSSYRVRPPFDVSLFTTKYYGCRICRQSREFFQGRSVALLNNRMTGSVSVGKNEIRMNWLALCKPFDFHEVRILQASDKEVEEFVMQAGNDTDTFR